MYKNRNHYRSRRLFGERETMAASVDNFQMRQNVAAPQYLITIAKSSVIIS